MNCDKCLDEIYDKYYYNTYSEMNYCLDCAENPDTLKSPETGTIMDEYEYEIFCQDPAETQRIMIFNSLAVRYLN